MATRNPIPDILEIRSRLLHGNSGAEISIRQIYLQSAFEKRRDVDPEFLRYFPVALVACFEGFFRLAVKELIDAGQPYLTNAAQLAATNKFDLESVIALHGKLTTIGEFIAHPLPWSNLKQVEANMSAILGKSFLNHMRIITDRVAIELDGKPPIPILADPDSTFRNVSRTFELRHIICHETATKFKISIEEIENIYDSSREFLKAATEIVSETLYPNAPLTQAAMNQSSYEEYQIAREELNNLVGAVSNNLSRDIKTNWIELQSSWESFADEAIKFEGSKYDGGSIQPLIHNTTATGLVRARITEVERELHHPYPDR